MGLLGPSEGSFIVFCTLRVLLQQLHREGSLFFCAFVYSTHAMREIIMFLPRMINHRLIPQ
jgi:hypothetical protein